MVRAVNLGVRHQRCFLRTAFGQHQPGQLLRRTARRPGNRQAHGERAAHRPQVAAQRQLAGKFITRQLAAINLPAGRQDAQRNRQVKAARILGQIGRRQVHGDALVARELQPGILDRRAHPLARFLDLGIGQPDQRETGQAVGQMHFDANRMRLQTQQRTAMH